MAYQNVIYLKHNNIILESQKMGNIAIFRKAKSNQISTLSHLINNHELTNQDTKLNPSKNNQNTVYIYDDGLKTAEFKRDGTNEKIIEKISEIEKRLDQEARADYTEYKTKEKLANPNKKIRTVLQSKNLKKEFIIAVGGDCQIDDPVKFEKDVLKTAFKILEHKGLEKKNLIALVVHKDESNALKSSHSWHIHCQYSDYSFTKHTTATQLEKPKITKDMTPEEKKQAHKNSRESFALFQDLTAEGLKMSRGETNSRVKHKTKAQFYDEKFKEVEQLERITAKLQKTKEKLEDEIKINQDMNLIINAGRDKSKKEMEEYQLQAQQAALKLTKLNKAVDSKEIKLDALERSINDVQLQKLSIDEPRHRDALFTIAMNLQPEDKQMEFIGNRAKETDNLMQEYGRFYDMKKPSSEPSFDKMVEDVRQANIAIQAQAKLDDLEELTIE
jgi:hypothetical protein